MSLRKRRRVEELPFAGLHDVVADPETVFFVVYGVAATLHPLDQAADDEGAELVPWPEGSSGPVLVDRFDCRLLLDSSDLGNDSTEIAKQRHDFYKPNNATAATAAAEIAEIEEQRWRDLFHPPSHLQHQHYYSSEDDEEERKKRTHGAAIPFSYLNETDALMDADRYNKLNKFNFDVHTDRERVYYLEDLDPPPPPPYLELLHASNNKKKDQAAPSLITFLKTYTNLDVGSGVTAIGTANGTGLLPFTARQYVIMERTAEFLHTNGDQGGGADILLYERAFSDPTFAFMSPSHMWNDFFKGLVLRMDRKIGNNVVASDFKQHWQKEQDNEGESGEKRDKVDEENVLGALLGGYGSEEEEEREENEEEQGREEQEVVKALIAHLIKASTTPSSLSSSAQIMALAQTIKERLSIDPVIASFINPGAPFYMLFKDAIEGAVTCGAMDENTAAIWLGKSRKDVDSRAEKDAMEATNAASKKGKANEEEPAGVSIPIAAAEEIKKEKKAEKARSNLEVVDEGKIEKRKEKVRLLLERQRQVAEERRQGQAVAKQQAEKERNQHLAAISVHKRMFLDNSDDD